MEGAVALGGPGFDLEVLDAPHFNARGLATTHPGGLLLGGGLSCYFVELRSQLTPCSSLSGRRRRRSRLSVRGSWPYYCFFACMCASTACVREMLSWPETLGWLLLRCVSQQKLELRRGCWTATI